MNKVYCEECDNLVEYTVEKKVFNEIVDGKEITYDGFLCVCKNCNEEVNVEEYDDINVENYREALRKSNESISIEEIKEILEKYNIGKKPLSILLGWGEVTISRYIDKGHIPSKKYSDILVGLKQPENMKRLILENGDKITEIAYKKVLERVNFELINDEKAITLDKELKISEVTKYILSKDYEITPLSLQKILYYVQGFYCAIFESWMFKDDCKAWVHGPVYEDVYFQYKEYKYNPIDRYEGIINLSDEEKSCIDVILRVFGCYNGKTLESFTHSEKPWRTSRTGLKDGENSNRIIDKQIIEEYFKDICDKFKILNTIDIKDYSSYLRENIL